jgi:hypothetical protein
MILPNFVLPSRVNLVRSYSGLDHPDRCLDKIHFESYPHDISYHYNSRGYRDQEWPDSVEDLKNAIWCVGESFTIGVGNPIHHTWPNLLGNQTTRRIINVSLSGGSNDWMARTVKNIVNEILPETIIVQWTDFYRRESTFKGDDETRRMPLNLLSHMTERDNIENFKNCVLDTQKNCKNLQLINSIIPNAYAGIDSMEVRGWWINDRQPLWPLQLPASLSEISQDILDTLKNTQQYNKYAIHYELQDFISSNNMILLNQFDEFFNKDLSRDGFHYGLPTATKFVSLLQSKFNLT